MEQLYDIMDERARRRQESGADPFRSNEEAWAEFVKYYMPKDPDSLIDPTTGIPLTPSWHGEDCMGNGEHPGLECCCDECDYYLACFPMERFPLKSWIAALATTLPALTMLASLSQKTENSNYKLPWKWQPMSKKGASS